MPEKPLNTSPAKSAVAATRIRGEHGHFIKKTPNSPNLLNVSENKTQNDETLIDVKVTNPLRRISAILEQIKRKQATVIDFKFTIPLVALPLFMLLAFSLGKTGATCGGNTQTKLGLLYILRTTSTQPSAGLFGQTKQILAKNLPFLASVLGTNQQSTENRTILIQRDNTALTIEKPNSVSLNAYHTRQVFVTGKVNTCEQTIEVDNESDVQLLP